jgi:prevent-host-death family protein
MIVSVDEVKDKLPELLQSVAAGDTVVIMSEGKPVAQIVQPPKTREVRLGTMRDRIKLKPGWDDPIDEDRFLAGDY